MSEVQLCERLEAVLASFEAALVRPNASAFR